MWERKGLLHNSQYAFRAKKGTEGPLLLWSLMNDRAYLRKEDQARGQGDLKHAYDGVQQWAVEVVLMRMGVPEEYVQYQAKLALLTRTAVITPFGLQFDKYREIIFFVTFIFTLIFTIFCFGLHPEQFKF